MTAIEAYYTLTDPRFGHSQPEVLAFIAREYGLEAETVVRAYVGRKWNPRPAVTMTV